MATAQPNAAFGTIAILMSGESAKTVPAGKVQGGRFGAAIRRGRLTMAAPQLRRAIRRAPQHSGLQ